MHAGTESSAPPAREPGGTARTGAHLDERLHQIIRLAAFIDQFQSVLRLSGGFFLAGSHRFAESIFRVQAEQQHGLRHAGGFLRRPKRPIVCPSITSAVTSSSRCAGRAMHEDRIIRRLGHQAALT